ncbi:hypothetical protein [Cetobacterium somerae]
MYGLSETDFFKIIDILKKYKEKIEWVKIFGSRLEEIIKKPQI